MDSGTSMLVVAGNRFSEELPNCTTGGSHVVQRTISLIDTIRSKEDAM